MLGSVIGVGHTKTNATLQFSDEGRDLTNTEI